MVKNKRIIIGVFFVIVTLITSVFIFKKDKNIEQILDSSSYSYLPKEAKNYIKEVYEKTGEVVLTEKNKQEDIPYLNPQYIDYLTMSSKEQESVDLIPDSTIVDYNASAVQGDVTYPATYDLRNLNNKNYITPIKNQGSLGICWAISTIENAETLAMLKSNTPYSNANSINQVFSSRQLDYASSSNGLIDYKINNTTYIFGNEDNSSRKLGESGNFYVSSILLANGLSLFKESDFPWSESSERVYPREVLDYSKSMYEADSTIQMGVINGDSATDSLLQSYISELKGNIINYGGPYVGTYSPESSCGFKNKDGNTVLKTDDCVSANSDKGHAMQIIGWNDNYSYEYCDDGTSHYKAQNGTCTKGTYTTGKGAWIIRNSWENTITYLYLTYDSTRITPSFVTKLSSMKNRSWDNNYHSNPWTTGKISGGIASAESVTQDFSTTSYEKEKIEKIKFLNRSSNAEYTLSIESGDKEYNNIATAKVNSVGIYTFDISNKNIIIEDNDFYVTIESTNGKKLGEDSISVFTSNVDKAKYINTYSSEAYDSSEPLSKYNPLYLTGDNYWGTDLTIYPKNFQPNTEFTYRLKRKNSDIVYNNFADIKTSLRNDYSEMILIGTRDAIDGYGSYTMEVLYNNQVIDTFPVKFNDSYSEIKFYANNGTDYYIKKSYKDDEDAVFNDIGSGDSKFYNDGYYITEWNTEPDGSGVSIELDEDFTVFADLDLYAQWSNKKISRTIRYKCNVSSSCAELDKIDKFNYDDEIVFRDNYLTKDGYTFLYWEGPEGNYYEGEKVLVDVFDKYQVYNNKISIYSPKWSNNYKTISFDSNSGTGTMSSIKVEPSVNNRIKYNSFTKEGYEFVGWNTKEDGTGDTYQDGGTISISEDITLYAMWEDERHPIKEVRLNKTVLVLEKGNSELLMATVIPTNTLFDKTITWKSSNDKVATVVNGKVTAVGVGTATITATSSNGKEAICEVEVTKPAQKVAYTTHVQDIGWQSYVRDGAMAGTSHQSKRLEGIKIKVENQDYEGDIEYRTHIQDIGWEKDFKKNDEMSGTSHQSKRLEAIEIKLTGELAEHYDVYYRVHAQDAGWMAWAKNGEQAGTSGYSRRLEGIEIVLVEKGKNPPTRTDTRTNKAFVKKQITYATHVQDYGWQDGVSDGTMSGTSHQSKRLEGIVIVLNKPEVSGNVEYRTHIQDIGWEKEFKKNGEMSGTSHQSKRLEAIEIKLTGEMAEKYDIYYRVHAQEFGWMGWAKNGESAGTAHYSYRLEAIEIVLVEKGENPPERTDTKTTKSFVDRKA